MRGVEFSRPLGRKRYDTKLGEIEGGKMMQDTPFDFCLLYS